MDLPIHAVASPEEDARVPFPSVGKPLAIECDAARLKIFDQEETCSVQKGLHEVNFELDVKQSGVTQLEACFLDRDGMQLGAYYVYVKRL